MNKELTITDIRAGVADQFDAKPNEFSILEAAEVARSQFEATPSSSTAESFVWALDELTSGPFSEDGQREIIVTYVRDSVETHGQQLSEKIAAGDFREPGDDPSAAFEQNDGYIENLLNRLRDLSEDFLYEHGHMESTTKGAAVESWDSHVAASPSDKWFDLSAHDLKLDRVPISEGSDLYRLEITMPEDWSRDSGSANFARQLEDLGWVKERADGNEVTFSNAQAANSTKMVAEKLAPWVSTEDATAAFKPIRDHENTPQVYGLTPSRSVRALSGLIEGVDLADKMRMTNAMNAAQRAVDARRQRQDERALGGNGNAVFYHIADTLENRRENPWPVIEAAALSAELVQNGLNNPLDQNGRFLNDLGKALRSGDVDAVASLTAGVLRQTETYAGADAKTFPGVESRVALIEKRTGDRAIMQQAYPEGASGVSYADVALYSVDKTASAMTSDGALGRENANDGLEAIKSKFPMQVRIEGTSTTVEAAQCLSAINKAMGRVASEMGCEPHNLLGGKRASFLNLGNERAVANAQVRGRQATVSTEGEERVLAINHSIVQGGAFIHELGHAIDSSWQLTEEDRMACIAASGMEAAIYDAVDSTFGMESKMRPYLRSSEEVFARMFDAHFVNLAREQGDRTLDTIGGSHVVKGYDRAAPYGNIEATTAFFNEVVSVVERRREAQLSADRELGQTEDVTYSSGPSR